MEQDGRLLELTADIVAAHVGHNNVPVGDVAGLVQRVHEALANLGTPATPQDDEVKPAVSVRSSVKADHLVCLVCGSRQKTLRRHIGVAHAMTPQEYRARYSLSPSYPMVAPDYTTRRREIAHALGLGRNRKGRGKAGAASPAAGGDEPPKRRRGRPKAS